MSQYNYFVKGGLMVVLNAGAKNVAMNYAEKLQDEIEHIPQEYLPALLNIVHSFRESVSLKPAEDSFKQGWNEVMRGETQPIETLWDGIDV